MVAASLFVQAMFFLVVAMGVLGVLEGVFGYKMADAAWLIPVLFIGAFLLFNGISIYEYFVKKRVAKLGSGSVREVIDGLRAVVAADSQHLSMIIFLLPRGIDRILNGKESVSQQDHT